MDDMTLNHWNPPQNSFDTKNVLIIGQRGCGKTTLINELKGDSNVKEVRNLTELKGRNNIKKMISVLDNFRGNLHDLIAVERTGVFVTLQYAPPATVLDPIVRSIFDYIIIFSVDSLSDLYYNGLVSSGFTSLEQFLSVARITLTDHRCFIIDKSYKNLNALSWYQTKTPDLGNDLRRSNDLKKQSPPAKPIPVNKSEKEKKIKPEEERGGGDPRPVIPVPKNSTQFETIKITKGS